MKFIFYNIVFIFLLSCTNQLSELKKIDTNINYTFMSILIGYKNGYTHKFCDYNVIDTSGLKCKIDTNFNHGIYVSNSQFQVLSDEIPKIEKLTGKKNNINFYITIYKNSEEIYHCQLENNMQIKVFIRKLNLITEDSLSLLQIAECIVWAFDLPNKVEELYNSLNEE